MGAQRRPQRSKCSVEIALQNYVSQACLQYSPAIESILVNIF